MNRCSGITPEKISTKYASLKKVFSTKKEKEYKENLKIKGAHSTKIK